MLPQTKPTYQPPPQYGVPTALPNQPDAEYEQLTYQNCREKIINIKSRFTEVVERVKTERITRRLDGIDEVGKDIGNMSPADIIIPMPLINTTISREQPSYIQYLVQPNRAAVIKRVGDKNFNTAHVEDELTRCVRYEGWDFPFLKCVDGSQAHGWSYVMPIFDISKPGHISFQYVATDDLLFPLGVKDFQSSEYIAVRETMTLLELKMLQRSGNPNLNPAAVKELIEHLTNNKNTAVEVFHFFCKHEGQVMHGWLSLDKNNDFLIMPKPLFLGEVDEQGAEVYETTYPLHPFIYLETEEKCFNDHRGRSNLDRSKQRAQTALASAFINKELRAANVYAAVDAKSNVMGAEPKQLDVRLENGSIWNVPMTFFSSEGGSNVTLMGLQYFEAQYSNESGQLNYAVANRKDSRKTAAEVKSAESEQQELDMIQVLLFALFLQSLFTSVFRIIRSRALADLLPFCALPDGSGNDKQLLSLEYSVYPSGDVDVVERQKKVEQMQQFWPVVAQTPIAPQFLSKLLDYAFPDENFGGQMMQMMAQQQAAAQQDNDNQLKQLLAATFQILQDTTTDEELKAMDDATRAKLSNLSQMVKQALAAPATQPGQPPQPGQQPMQMPQQPPQPPQQ